MGKKSRLKKEKKREVVPALPAAARFPFWMIAAVAIVAILGVISTISYQFVFDDDYQILRNTWIRDWSNIGRLFTTNVWAFTGAQTSSNYYRPLHMLIYMAVYSLGGLKPQSFHLMNILLHALCSVLVSLIGIRLTGRKSIGIAAGLLFALHPIHAESVAWIAGVTDPLCAAFYFSALYFYLTSSREENERKALYLAIGLFAGALFSKEMAFTFPIAAVWLDWCLHRKLRWSRYLMFAGVFAVYSLLRVVALGSFSSHHEFRFGFSSWVLNAIALLAQYVAKMFVPYGINAFHVFKPVTTPFSGSFALGLLLLAVFAGAAWILRGQRTLLFLFGLCILTIAPVLNLSGIGENVFADRYLYIPTLGSCLLIPVLAAYLAQRWHARPKWLDVRAGFALLAIVLAAGAWMLQKEMSVWRDTPTLYHATLERSPGASLIAHNLARYYFYRGDLDNAEKWEVRSLELWHQSFLRVKQNLVNAYLGLGGISYGRGKFIEARDYFAKAYEQMPNNEAALQNLGSVSLALGLYDQGLGFYDAAIKVNPNSEVSYSNMAAIQLAAGRYDQAIADAQKALHIYPHFSDAWVNLARAYRAKGMKEDAYKAYMNLKSIDPSRASFADAELKAMASDK